MNTPVLSRIESRSEVLHAEMANAVRFLAIDAVEKAKSGHPGMPMGMADVATVLFSRFLKFDPTEPAWPDRDRFVLSAGHGSMLLYALLHLTGYAARIQAVGIEDAGAPGVWPHPRRGDDHRPARAGHCDRRRHSARRTADERALR
jgi:transketolase N-terminal domain/subunit